MQNSWQRTAQASPFWIKKQKKRNKKRRRIKAEKKRAARRIKDAFLRSREWRTLRYEALKLHGAKCQCCGVSSADGAVLNVDHIKPRSTHPELALEIDNLQVLCSWCNIGKGRWDSTDWRSL